MQEKIKYLRLTLDGLSQLTNDLKPIENVVKVFNPYFNSDQIERCVQKLLYSKAWLGRCMGELGVPTPYKNDGNRKEVKDIEPNSDKVNFNVKVEGKIVPIDTEGNHIGNYANLNHIEKVDWLRQEIEKVVNEIKELPKKDFTKSDPTREFSIARTNAYNYSCEARFELGFEIERLRNEQKQ